MKSRKLYAQEYYQKNKAVVGARSKERYWRLKDEILAKHREAHANRDPRELILQRAKSRARREGIPFNLVLADIILPDVCPVFGFPLKRNVGEKFGKDNSYSIDKIIPKLGYVRGNIQILSHKANVMKHNATPEELRRFALWVLSEDA